MWRVRPSGAETRPAAGLRTTFESLSNRDFVRLWLGLQVMGFATQMQMLARTFLAYEITGSAVILGVVAAGTALPQLALGLFGGAVADRVDRKRLVQAGQFGIAAVAALVALSITTETVTWGHLLVGSLLQGAIFAVLAPARHALIPQLVTRRQLGNAMAVTAAGRSATTLVSPATAGVLYIVIGPAGVYYLVASLCLVAVVLTSSIRQVTERQAAARSKVLSEIKAGLSYIRKSRTVLVLLAVGSTTVFLAVPFVYLLPVFVVDVYGREAGAFGVLISVMGLGTMVGSITVASLGNRRRGLLLVVGGLLSAFALLLVALVPLYYAALSVMFVLGLGSVAHLMLSQALIMEQVDDEFRGRVMSVSQLSSGSLPLVLLPIGLAMEAIGSRPTVGILGVTLLVVSTTVLVTQKRLRGLQ